MAASAEQIQSELNSIYRSCAETPEDPLHYLRLKAPAGQIPVASSRMISEFSRPFIDPLFLNDAAFEKVLRHCQVIYFSMTPNLPLSEQCKEVQEGIVVLATYSNSGIETLYASISERRACFEQCSSSAIPFSWGVRLIPKDPPVLDPSEAMINRNEIIPYLDLSPRRAPVMEPGPESLQALVELEQYWIDEHKLLDLQRENSLDRQQFEEEFGRDYDPDFDLPIDYGEFDFEKWDKLVIAARDRHLALFYEWIEKNGAHTCRIPAVELTGFRLLFEQLFIFCYQSETGEMLAISEMKRPELRLFILEHLLCAVCQKPIEYLNWVPILRLYFRYLGEIKYLRWTSKLDSIFRSINQELTQYILRQYS